MKTKQFWSVPFVSDKKRRKYLTTVKNDIRRDLGYETKRESDRSSIGVEFFRTPKMKPSLS